MACINACIQGQVQCHAQARAYPGGAQTPAPLLGLGTSLPPAITAGRYRTHTRRKTPPQPVEDRKPSVPHLTCSRSFRNLGVTRAQSLRRNPSVLKRYPSCKIWDPRTWVVFKPEEDYEEKETAIEIEAGSLKASIPMVKPFTKPISLTRKPSLLRSPSSCLALSLALSFQFPLSLPMANSKELLLPIGLSLTLTLSLIPFLAGGGAASASCAEGALEVSVGQANATVPLCLPVSNHLPHLHTWIPRAASLVKHLSHHAPHLAVA